MSYKFLILLFLAGCFLNFNELKGQTDSLIVPSSSSASKDTAFLVKSMLMDMFGVTGIPAVHSRKSCNCGCDIRKEAYVIESKGKRFESYDFCDSQVFEWYNTEGDSNQLIKDVQNGLIKLGYISLNGIPVRRNKFKTEKYRIEGKDVLTFIEVTQLKDKSIKLKLSMATP